MGVEVENRMELLSPYAPLWPWLERPLGVVLVLHKAYSFPLCPKCGTTMEPVRQGKNSALNSEQFDTVKAGDWFCRCHNNDRGNQPFGYYRERELPPLYSIDLRPFAMRAVALHALASVGYSLPWALGGIWSPLTDEQAGRVVAEAIRRVGEDPRKPCGVVPIGVLGPCEVHTGAGLYPGVARYGRPIFVGKPPMPVSYGWVNNRKPSSGREHMLQTWFCGGDSGPEKGDAGIVASEVCAMAKGALLWEQVTPEVKA